MSTKAIIGIFVFTTTPYVFTTVDRLIEDFRRDMAAVKKEIGR
jgi:hypothetical protein